MSMGSRLQAVSDYKNNDFEALKMEDYVKKMAIIPKQLMHIFW